MQTSLCHFMFEDLNINRVERTNRHSWAEFCELIVILYFYFFFQPYCLNVKGCEVERLSENKVQGSLLLHYIIVKTISRVFSNQYSVFVQPQKASGSPSEETATSVICFKWNYPPPPCQKIAEPHYHFESQIYSQAVVVAGFRLIQLLGSTAEVHGVDSVLRHSFGTLWTSFSPVGAVGVGNVTQTC